MSSGSAMAALVFAVLLLVVAVALAVWRCFCPPCCVWCVRQHLIMAEGINCEIMCYMKTNCWVNGNAYLDKRNACETCVFTCHNVNMVAGGVGWNEKYNLRLFAQMSGKSIVVLLKHGSCALGVSHGCSEIMWEDNGNFNIFTAYIYLNWIN